jgi:hypothetical protein
MLHAGLDLSRRKVDVCLLSSAGEIVDEWASPPDADGLRGLAARAAMWDPTVRGVIESMNGARFVHDRLEEHRWDVLIAGRFVVSVAIFFAMAMGLFLATSMTVIASVVYAALATVIWATLAVLWIRTAARRR